MTPLNVAVDSVAMFIASFGWALIVWLPIVLVVVFFRLRKTAASVAGLTLFLVALAVTLIVSGLFLKWMAQGLVLRKWVRTVALSLTLATLGILEIRAYFLPQQPVMHPHKLLAQGVMWLMVAAVAALGLSDKAKLFED